MEEKSEKKKENPNNKMIYGVVLDLSSRVGKLEGKIDTTRWVVGIILTFQAVILGFLMKMVFI